MPCSMSTLASLLVLVCVHGANLELPGSESKISFGSGNSKGDLTLSCNQASARVKMLGSSTAGSGNGATFTASASGIGGSIAIELENVPTTCVGVAIDQPCVKHNDAHPSMFYLEFEGATSATTVGPFDAENAAITLPGKTEPVGHAVYLTVAMSSLSLAKLFEITGYTGDGETLEGVKVTVKYGTTVDSAVEIPFEGIAGADEISIGGLSFAQPPSSPPPMPPSSPPIPPSLPPPPPGLPGLPTCQDWKDAGSTTTGTYQLLDSSGNIYDNICEMDTDGGGWTMVLKAKGDGDTYWHRTNSAPWTTATGDMSSVADENALGKAYELVPFTDVMLRPIRSDGLKSGQVGWRHGESFSNMKSVISGCVRKQTTNLLFGSFPALFCTNQNSANSIPSNCESALSPTCSGAQYGFFTYEGTGPGFSSAGCSNMATVWAAAAIGVGMTGNGNLCLSSGGVGSGYSGTDTSADNGYGINYHWWGAGNYRLGHNIPFASIGVFVR